MDEKAQQKLMEFQMMHQHIQQIQQQLQLMEQQLADIAAVEEGLQELQHVKKGTSILVPMTNGIFCKATIEDPKELIVNVGASTTIQKPIKDVIKLIKEQAGEMEKVQAELAAQLEKVTKKAQGLEQDLSE